MLLASGVLGEGWHLGGPWPISPAIGDVVCVVVVMTEKGWPGTGKLLVGLGVAGMQHVRHTAVVRST